MREPPPNLRSLAARIRNFAKSRERTEQRVQRAIANLATDIVEMFEEIGLPRPQPLPLLAVEHQIAQKLHACTAVNPKTAGNERAHDLVDLQILHQEEAFDLAVTNEIADRLFASRRTAPWPPTVVAYERWDTIYAEAADGLDVLEGVDAAVVWANEFIDEIVHAARSPTSR